MNGTFVTTQGGAEERMHGRECALTGRGWIAFGESRTRTEEVVQYACEDGAW
jgi:hypothetical protein